MTDYKLIAKSSSIFTGLSDMEKEDLIKDGKLRCINKKEFLFRHGDPLRNFYLICFGAIQLVRNNANGVEKTLNILTANDPIYCDLSDNHEFSAVAVNDAVVLEFSKMWMKESLTKCSNFAISLLAVISHRAKMAELEAENQATMSATQLVACFLQELCLTHNFDPHGFKLPYSKKLIASRLGMEIETLSRTLPKLRDFGITVAGSYVKIQSINTVAQNVCDHCSIEMECPIKNSFKSKLREIGN